MTVDTRHAVGPDEWRDPYGRPDRGWVATYSGKRVWPLDPRPEDISLEDIAHALSMKCRYSGHTKRFYSVAQHCRIVSFHVPAELAAYGLLHDAAEYVLPDIARPIKAAIPGFDKIEARLMRAIAERFGLDFEKFNDPEIHKIDTRILGDEMEQLMDCPIEYDPVTRFGELGVLIVPDTPHWAERGFLQRAYELGIKD